MNTPEHLPVFVYGTLRPGGSNNGWFRGKDGLREAAVFRGGVLVDKGSYPYLLETEDGAEVVGTLVRIEPGDWAEVSASLDELEDTDPAEPVSDKNLYNRLVRTVYTDSGPVDAWVYIPPACHQAELRRRYPVIESGDWLER